MDEELLIITLPYHLKSAEKKIIHDDIVAQRKTGVIILPMGFNVVRAPEDVKIRIAEEQ